MAITLSILN